jgi:hypothetical protein
VENKTIAYYKEVAEKEAENHDLDAKMFKEIINCESGFDPKANHDGGMEKELLVFGEKLLLVGTNNSSMESLTTTNKRIKSNLWPELFKRERNIEMTGQVGTNTKNMVFVSIIKLEKYKQIKIKMGKMLLTINSRKNIISL